MNDGVNEEKCKAVAKLLIAVLEEAGTTDIEDIAVLASMLASAISGCGNQRAGLASIMTIAIAMGIDVAFLAKDRGSEETLQ